MSSTQFTPGPWRTSNHFTDHKNASIAVGSDDENRDYVCYVSDFEGMPCKANAHLIAAAPELLKSLEEIIAISDRKHDAWDKAKAVIAKAKGGSR